MKKKSFKPGAMLNPVPAVMVSCGTADTSNIITIAWTGIVNSNPPMTYVSVRRERYSHPILTEQREFTINLCTRQLALAADYCGVKSGREVDKFAAQGLTKIPGEKVACPSIGESPVNLECKVTEIHSYGSHDMFVAEIINVRVDEQRIDESGRIRLDQSDLICYNHGEYFGLEKQSLGRFGYSVMKPKTRKRLAAEQHKKRHPNTKQKRKKERSR